jgi:hypothetical protein
VSSQSALHGGKTASGDLELGLDDCFVSFDGRELDTGSEQVRIDSPQSLASLSLLTFCMAQLPLQGLRFSRYSGFAREKLRGRGLLRRCLSTGPVCRREGEKYASRQSGVAHGSYAHGACSNISYYTTACRVPFGAAAWQE